MSQMHISNNSSSNNNNSIIEMPQWGKGKQNKVTWLYIN